MYKNTIGVIPGRFQVPDLHEGHRHLIDTVCARHETVLIVLCSARGFATSRNPLPFAVREHMIRAAYPNVQVVELFDHPISSVYWSRDLDALIESHYPDNGAVLYGSRDCFIPQYHGKFNAVSIGEVSTTSGTTLRQSLPYPTTAEGRAGLIYGVMVRPPIVYRTADIAITDTASKRVLLTGKHIHEGYLAFAGGFNDRIGESDMETAIRERVEEVPGIQVGNYQFIGSFPVEDPRYWGTADGITTSLFRTEYLGGEPTAADDIDVVEWVAADALLERLVPWHRQLATTLLAQWSI